MFTKLSVQHCWRPRLCRPVCHCGWPRTGWCAGSWRPWRCPAGGRRRRSCCNVRAETLTCTRPGTGRSAGWEDSQSSVSSYLEHVHVFEWWTFSAYVVGEDHSKLPDLVFDVNGCDPAQKEEISGDVVLVSTNRNGFSSGVPKRTSWIWRCQVQTSSRVSWRWRPGRPSPCPAAPRSSLGRRCRRTYPAPTDKT